MVRRRVCALACAGWLWSSGVEAANTAKPRVSPSFLGGACVQTIERGAPLSFALGIPYEDAALTPDEPADSRTFQFFALCRDPGPLEGLPRWIDADDVTRAQAVNATIEEPSAEDVLASATAWAGPGYDGGDGSCVVAMTREEERMPITCAATEQGFAWDGGDAPAGSYVVYGYTFEPDQNAWAARGGVVRVIDPTAPDAAGPAVAFSFPLGEVEASFQGGVRVTGCMAGVEGTTLGVDWATAPMLDTAGDDAWNALPEVEVEDGTFAVDFVPPPQAEYKAVFFRARAEDPMGRSFVAHTHAPVIVVPGCAQARGGRLATIDSCGVGVPGDWSTPAANAIDCEAGDGTTGEDETGTPDESDTDTESSGATEPGGDGCGCRTSTGGGLAWLLFACLPRRRRSAAVVR